MSPVSGEKRYVEFLSGHCASVAGVRREGKHVHVPPAARAAHACSPRHAEADEEALLPRGSVLARGAAFGVRL